MKRHKYFTLRRLDKCRMLVECSILDISGYLHIFYNILYANENVLLKYTKDYFLMK